MRVGRVLSASVVAFSGVLFFALLVRPIFDHAPEGPHRVPGRLSGDLRQLLSRDAIRPVYEPRFVEAAGAEIVPGDLVIGLELRGQARAYPVGFLNFREMVNDRIGPVPFLVTW